MSNSSVLSQIKVTDYDTEELGRRKEEKGQRNRFLRTKSFYSLTLRTLLLLRADTCEQDQGN